MNMYKCVHVHLSIYVCIYVYICECIYVYICMHVYICVQVLVVVFYAAECRYNAAIYIKTSHPAQQVQVAYSGQLGTRSRRPMSCPYGRAMGRLLESYFEIMRRVVLGFGCICPHIWTLCEYMNVYVSVCACV